MSGIMGFSLPHIPNDSGHSILQAMASTVCFRDTYRVDSFFQHNAIQATRVHNNIIQPNAQPYRSSTVYTWLDGEFYNQSAFRSDESCSDATDIEIFSGLYCHHNDFTFLERIDGLYSAVIYDADQKKIHLITDRYGLRYLYWSKYEGGLVWASDLKTFLALPNFEPHIDREAVEQFLQIGYCLEDRTWFENVRLVPPGSVLSWDIETNDLQSQQYWWWDKIQPLSEQRTEADIAEQLFHLFQTSINRRSKEADKVGVTLSGGLDSRAILAAMPDQASHIHAVTLGKQGCDDITLAAQAIQAK